MTPALLINVWPPAWNKSRTPPPKSPFVGDPAGLEVWYHVKSMIITYDTLAACISPPALALLCSPPAPRETSACAVGSSFLSRKSRCSHSTQTRGSACRGSCLHTTHVSNCNSSKKVSFTVRSYFLSLALFSRFGVWEVPDWFLITTQLWLTAFWHHALLHLQHLCSANRAISRRHLHQALPPLHAETTSGAADIPFTPLGNQATAGSWAREGRVRVQWSCSCTYYGAPVGMWGEKILMGGWGVEKYALTSARSRKSVFSPPINFFSPHSCPFRASITYTSAPQWSWNEAGKLTALLIDHAVLGLLRRQRADGAVVWELLHVALPRTRAHPAGRAARGPCDPLRHHAGGGIWTQKSEEKFPEYLLTSCLLSPFLKCIFNVFVDGNMINPWKKEEQVIQKGLEHNHN